MDILTIRERIRNSLELGESHFREFKSAWEGPATDRKPRDPKSVARDIGEALVAFSNADGGDLLVGVEDDGTITGIPFKEGTISQLLEACKNNIHIDTPLDSPIARTIPLENKSILYFSVDKSTRYIHLTSDGRCLQRRDRQNLPVAIEKLQFERQEQISREYDRHFIDEATVLDLDIDLVKTVADFVAKGMSPEKFLQFDGLAEFGMGSLQLRRAAMLLFAQDVSRWHPRCGVRIVRVRGLELKTGRDYNAVSDEISSGNIILLLTSAWEKLRPHLVETKLAPDALFRERVMYPEDACREALINAIAHRDYSNEGSNIEIFIFDDRMEIRSPGGLLSTVKLDELKKLQGLHQSRNALIARVLREIGYMREVGEGMRRIFGLMKQHDLVPPELYSEPSRFSIILRHKSVFSDADQRWLDGFKPLKLTREEMLVILLGKNGDLVSPQQIWDTLGLVDTENYRAVVEQMQAKGILYNTKPRTKGLGRAGVSRRSVKRLLIRSPEEIENNLSGLYAILAQAQPFLVATEKIIKDILESLPDDNIYKSNPGRISYLLRLLGILDDNKEPTPLLQGLWKARVTSPQQTDPTLKVRETSSRQAKNTSKSRETYMKQSTSSLNVNEVTLQKIGEISNTSKVRPSQTKRRPRDIYVGNLDYNITRDEIASVFDRYGSVVSIVLPIDLYTQKNRGFGFVKMLNEDEAIKAVEELNGAELRGRPLLLNWAYRSDA